MLGRSISKNSLILGAFAAATAALIAATFESTEAKIAAAEKHAAQQALLQIVPQQRHNNDLLETAVPLSAAQAKALGVADGTVAYVAKMDDQPVAVILSTVAPDGYSGAIKMVVGINMDGSVAGVRVLSHRETPGLGDKIELSKSPWILSFNNRSLTNPEADRWGVKKEGGAFDQFTGATITPRAVVNQVKETLVFFAEHGEDIVTQAEKPSLPSGR